MSKIVFCEQSSLFSEPDLAVIESSDILSIPRAGDIISFEGKHVTFTRKVNEVWFIYDTNENYVKVFVEKDSEPENDY